MEITKKNTIILNNTNFIIHEARWAKVTNQWKNFVSIYPYNRLYLVTEGEATIILNNKELHLEKNYCYFIPAFNVISATCNKSMMHYFIHFQVEQQLTHNIFNFYNLPNKIKATELSLQLFQTAVSNRLQKNIHESFYINGSLQILLAPFFEQAEPQIIADERLYDVIEYINANIFKDIKIAELANIMNLTVNYFSSLFKKSFGISPKNYIIEKKLIKAQTMIADNDMSIKEIAYSLSFENETYFSRLFKKKIKMTPTQFRNQINY